MIPEDPGFVNRVKLYKLYHYLNHYNLFGGGYYGSCTSILSDLTSKIKWNFYWALVFYNNHGVKFIYLYSCVWEF